MAAYFAARVAAAAGIDPICGAFTRRGRGKRGIRVRHARHAHSPPCVRCSRRLQLVAFDRCFLAAPPTLIWYYGACAASLRSWRLRFSSR
eukprot:90274-Prymnesium_polylepis.1